MNAKRTLALTAFSALALCAARLQAAGEAEWNSGVQSLNSVKKELNQNSGTLRKAGVNVSDLQNRISQLESEMNRLRAQMARSNSSFLQNSYKPNNILFSPLSGDKHLVPVPWMVDMGLSNPFTGSSKLVPSNHLVDISPSGDGFRPFRSPEEALKDYTSYSKPEPKPKTSDDSAAGLAKPPGAVSAGGSSPGNPIAPQGPNSVQGGGLFNSPGVVNPAAISGNNASSSGYGYVNPASISANNASPAGNGVVNPAAVSGNFTPQYSLGSPINGQSEGPVATRDSLVKVAPPPLPDPPPPPTAAEKMVSAGQQFYDKAMESVNSLKNADYGADFCVSGKADDAGGKACYDPFNKTFTFGISNNDVSSDWSYSLKKRALVETSAGYGKEFNYGGNVFGVNVSKVTDMDNNTGTKFSGSIGKGVGNSSTGAAVSFDPSVKFNDK